MGDSRSGVLRITVTSAETLQLPEDLSVKLEVDRSTARRTNFCLPVHSTSFCSNLLEKRKVTCFITVNQGFISDDSNCGPPCSRIALSSRRVLQAERTKGIVGSLKEKSVGKKSGAYSTPEHEVQTFLCV